MNNTIPLPQIISQLAQLTDCDAATSRKFLHEFFALIESSLVAGESVKIKSIGTFSRSENPDEPVYFIPDDELAEGVNLPFAMFEPIVLSDDISEEDLLAVNDSDSEAVTDGEEPTTEAIVEPEPELKPEVVSEPATEVEDEPTTEEEPEQATEPEPEEIPEPESEQVPEVEEAPTAEAEPIAEEEPVKEEKQEEVVSENTDYDYAESYSQSPRRTGVGRHIFYGVLIFLVGAIAGNMLHHYFNFDCMLYGISDKQLVAIETTKIDSLTTSLDSLINKELAQKAEADSMAVAAEKAAEEVKQEPAKEPIYDTITHERFLTTMARHYYGVMDYWVFIYQANADKLGHPNKIKPGTKVVIPPLEEYATEPTKAENLAKARRMAEEIYARY